MSSFQSKGWHPPEPLSVGERSMADALLYDSALRHTERLLPALPRLKTAPDATAEARSEQMNQIRSFLALAETAALVRYTRLAEQPLTMAVAWNDSGREQVERVTAPSPEAQRAEAAATLARQGERPERIEEILAQNFEPDTFMLDAVGATQAAMPHTHALARFVLMAANQVSLRLKGEFALPRPFETAAGANIRPLVMAPAHSSFPGGHAMQAAAVAEVLIGLCRQGQLLALSNDGATALRALAERIADNRVVAGLHYQADSAEGLRLGKWIGERLRALFEAGPADTRRYMQEIYTLALAEWQ
jgi:hypothetical protein